jgi:hypothetical protein
MDLSIYNPTFTPRPAAQPGAARARASQPAEAGQARSAEASPSNGANRVGEGAAARSPEAARDPREQQQIRRLEARDREVRSHEAAHLAAGGRHVEGGARFEFQRGPNGRLYAVGGEVQIDTSRPDDPADQIEKAEALVRTALAPAEPSPQDLRVAAEARAMAAEARAELQRERGREDGPPESRGDSAYRLAAEGDPADRSGGGIDRTV